MYLSKKVYACSDYDKNVYKYKTIKQLNNPKDKYIKIGCG